MISLLFRLLFHLPLLLIVTIEYEQLTELTIK